MKKLINKHKILLLSASILLNAGCTKDFVEDNSDKNAITSISKSEFPLVFNRALSVTMMNGAFYETTHNYYADIYSQYFAKSVATERYSVDLTNYVDRMYTLAYSRGGASLKIIMDNAEPQSAETALSNIVWVYSFSRLTDQVGPIPYSKAFANNGQVIVDYDKMEDIYNDFFIRLTEAVNVLKSKDASTIVFNAKDNLYSGNINRWIKFANTLKLRLAMRISKVNPTKAKQMAEEAIASGVLTDNADNATVARSIVGNDYNAVAMISTWNATSMSSTIKSYLDGYSDPRLSIFFQKRPNATEFKARRNGMSATNLGSAGNGNADQSIAGPYWVSFNGSTAVSNSNARQQIMCAAEGYFLRAEAALNGWNAGGTAKDLYEDGIRKSMQQWGVTNAVEDYINSTNLPSAPNDYHNSPAVSTTPIKWAGSIDMQRKQIGTQKWLAVYPDGVEAWTEFRRTGYPDLYTVLNSDNADLPVGTFIKRLVYHQSEYTRNLQGVETGIALLNGPDKASTKLWWDID